MKRPFVRRQQDQQGIGALHDDVDALRRAVGLKAAA